MNKSLFIASFAVLTASVFGMDSGYHGESSSGSHSNQLLRDIKQENLGAMASTQNFESNVQNSASSGSNVLELMKQVLNENQSSKLEIQQKNKEIQELRNKLASEYVTSSKLSEKLTKSQKWNQRLNKINKNLTIFDNRRGNNPRKRSRSAGEEQLKREFELADLYRLRNVLYKKDEVISEHQNKRLALEKEILEKDKNIENLTKRLNNSLNGRRNLKRKLDETTQEVNMLKKQLSLKVFDGEVLDTEKHPEIDLSKYRAFPNLEELTIRADQLSDILLNKPDLSKVEDLEIIGGENPLNIEQLANMLSYVKNLRNLGLEDNQLLTLPKEIGDLKHLVGLYASRNQLIVLPREIGNLKLLEGLYLGKNQLSSLPKEMGNLKNLKHLYLWENKLTELPEEIYELPKLEELDLQYNPLNLPSKDFVSSDVKIYQ